MNGLFITFFVLITTSFSYCVNASSAISDEELLTVERHGRLLTFTVRRIREADLPQMQEKFVAAYGHQYQRWTLADLGKESAIDPRTSKLFNSIPSWLEVVAKGEAEEITGELYSAIVDCINGKEADSNRIDIAAVDEHGALVAYAGVKIMNNGRVAYLAQGFVMPEYQKLGMERFFMSYLNRVVPTSVEAFTLLVRDPHNQGAIDAHTHVGFRKIDRDLSAQYAAILEYPARWYSTMVCLRSGSADVDGYMARLLKAAV